MSTKSRNGKMMTTMTVINGENRYRYIIDHNNNKNLAVKINCKDASGILN